MMIALVVTLPPSTFSVSISGDSKRASMFPEESTLTQPEGALMVKDGMLAVDLDVVSCLKTKGLVWTSPLSLIAGVGVVVRVGSCCHWPSCWGRLEGEGAERNFLIPEVMFSQKPVPAPK